MCVVKTPKIQTPTDSNKPLPVLRNPLLDGLDQSIRSTRMGRSSLRIDRGGDETNTRSGIRIPIMGN
ncbi:hypothetical protein [Sphingomonas sp. J315]|uniref:hypothetical protein n=1 Tax=Sphingomonas sp. J315 TaxID=2898433 RepID=UPI0021AD6BC9|nr:hypothetical protein [Sphingomonas sp. J315]UUY00979.1 hypothetical protein LRS08_07965 [Sphingomonas sp. J315]